MIRRRHAIALMIAIGGLFAGLPARTQSLSGDPHNPIRLYPYIDVPLTLISAGFYFVPSVVRDPLPEDDCFPCDPDTINALDRSVVNYHSTSAGVTSDALIIALPIAAAGMTLTNLADPHAGASAMLQDLLLMTEAVMTTGMLATFIKRSVHRPRPYMYMDDPPENYRHYDEGDYASFISGHTSTAFAIATSLSTLYTIRNPKGQGRIWVWIISMSSATAVGLLRVFAGKHFWTDVVGGALLGSAIGVSVPLLHRSPRHQVNVSAGITSLQLNVRF